MAVGASFTVEITDLVERIRSVIQNVSTRPIFHRAIDSSKGIRITGKFKTTHATVPSPMSYITVRRRPDKAVAADGLGLAWRTGYAASGQYNVYFVDNNILTDDVPIRTENMIIEENLNNFLGYGIANIEPNVDYKFGIEIDSTWGMKACVYSGSASGGPNFDSAYDGATNVSGYIMSMGARLDGHEPQASGTHFGISVYETENADWIYDDIRITTIVDGHVASLFKLYADPSDFDETLGGRLTLKGAGHGDPGVWGITWCLWNVNDEAWETIGANAESTTEIVTYDIPAVSGYVDAQSYINVMAIVDSAASDGELNIDYVKLTTPVASGIHAGHMTDVYVHAPASIMRATAVLTDIANNVAELDSLNHPIYQIEEVYYTAGGPLLGALVRENALDTGRYVLQNSSPHYTYSMYESLALSVPLNASLSVVYTYYADGSTVQAFVEDDAYRMPTTDNLIKIAPPAVITINQLDYRGAVSETTLQTKIASFINALVRESFEVTDLIAYLYTLGVTYVDLSTLDISITVYDVDGTLLAEDEAITTTYSISEPNTFYTDSTKLLGITKL